MRYYAERVDKGSGERGVRWCGGCGFGDLGGVYGSEALEGMLEDADEKFDEEARGEGGDAGAGYGALLIECCIFEGLLRCKLMCLCQIVI